MEELKDCPFCGSKAHLKLGNQCVWIECGSCHCRSTTFRPNSEHGDDNDAKCIKVAIESWNERMRCLDGWEKVPRR